LRYGSPFIQLRRAFGIQQIDAEQEVEE